MNYARLLTILFLALAIAGCSSSGSQRDGSGRGGEQREQTAEQMYNQAQRQMERRDYSGAAETLENLQARYPFGPYFKQAQLDLINTYFQQEEMGSAIAAADRFIRLNPRDEHVPYAIYMRGRSNLERGNDLLTRTFGIDRRVRDPSPLREAMNDFMRVAENYPDSEYANDSRERVGQLRRDLAYHEMHVTRWYMSRGAYVAAANRAMGVVENFQGTPQVQEALGVLVDAYSALELDDLRRDVLRIIEENYPDHPSLRDRRRFLPRLGME